MIRGQLRIGESPTISAALPKACVLKAPQIFSQYDDVRMQRQLPKTIEIVFVLFWESLKVSALMPSS